MSGILNSNLSSSNSSVSDSTGRSFGSSFSGQSANAPTFHHSGGMQGLHNMHGNFVSNTPGLFASRNSTLNSVPLSGLQPGSSITSGRFSSNNLQLAMSQISHGHSGIADRSGISVVGNPTYSSNINALGGSIHGFSSAASVSHHNPVSGFGANPILGYLGPRISNASGNNVGRSMNSSGANISTLASRANLAANNGSGTLDLQGPNRLMGSILQQAPQLMGMLRNSYNMSAGPVSQRQLQGGNNLLNSMGILNDVNPNDGSPFDINEFPQLTARPNSAGGIQGSLRKHGLGVNSIVQQNQEFCIQNEDFPALPGYKGGNSDYAMDLHQKEQSHENASVLLPQNFPMGRGAYPSNHRQHQQHATPVSTAGGISFASANNQDHFHQYVSEMFQSSHGAFHSQLHNNGPPNIGLRPLSSQNQAPGIGQYDQLMQQYPHSHNHSRVQLQQISAINQSYRDHNLRSMQVSQISERFGLLGLLSVIRGNDPNLTYLAMGMDLTTLGLNLLSSPGDLHKKFSSPWSDEPAKGEYEYTIPTCYYSKPPSLKQGHFAKLHIWTLFYIFYSMPKDEAQLFAAYELYSRSWFYHRELQLWLTRIEEPLVKTQTHERGSYQYFDPNTWQACVKENFVLTYEALEKKPTLP